MAMRGVNYDVKCMMCSAEVGQIWAGKFRQHNCGKAMPVLAGMARCCHCGGSLYLEPILEPELRGERLTGRPRRASA